VIWGRAISANSVVPKLNSRPYSLPVTAAVVLVSLVSMTIVSLSLGQNQTWIVGVNSVLLSVVSLATCLCIRNAIQSTQTVRQFWIFLAGGCGLRAMSSMIWIYNLVSKTRNVSQIWLSTFLLFLHILLLLTAVVGCPHLKSSSQKAYRATLSFFFPLLFWVFAYAYLMYPYRNAGASAIVLRFEEFYFPENVLLVAILAMLVIRTQGPWRTLYWNLLGASTVYAFSSLTANIHFARIGPPGGPVLIIVLASACWLVRVALQGRKLAPQLARAIRLNVPDMKYSSILAILALVVVPLVDVWDLLLKGSQTETHAVRLSIVLAGATLMAVVLLLRENLLNRELSSDAVLANDRLRLAMESGKTVAWDWDLRNGRDIWFGDLLTMFGIPQDTYAGRVEDFFLCIHPDDREIVWKTMIGARQSRKPYRTEFRLLWKDGTMRWVVATGKYYFSDHGEPIRMLGIAHDITDRKQMEEALSGLSRKLMEAQEEERTWIARELHDDLGQRMTLLTIEMEQLGQVPPHAAGEVPGRVQELCKQVVDLGRDISAISHRLHSSKLEYLGITAAAGAFCRELAEQHKIEIAFSSAGIPDNVPREIGLCLFRVLQEALHNAVKHAGVKYFNVALRGTSDEIRLEVGDAGIGFDPEAAIQSHGLGLISMQERLSLVHGEFVIDSRPGQGATVRARVPLRGHDYLAKAAG
jgi:PAS domain S-box-containing protein